MGDSKKILLAGYYGHRNIGDEAILFSIVDGLRSFIPDVDIDVVSGDPAETARACNVGTVSEGDLLGINRKVQESDLVILGGGGVFQDYWGGPINTVLTDKQAGIPFYSSFPLLAHMLDRPFMVFSVGVGPLFSQDAKEMTRYSFTMANAASVRDIESLALLKKMKIAVDKIRVSADPAFNRPAEMQASGRLLAELNLPVNNPRIGVCLRNWDGSGESRDWQNRVASALDRFIEEIDAHLIFIPFQDLSTYPLTNDLTIANSIIAQMKNHGSTSLFQHTLSPQVTAGVLAQCDFVIGMRFHSLVFAAKAGVPCVGLSYDPKVYNLLSRLGLQEYGVQLEDLSEEKLFNTLLLGWKNRLKIAGQLQASADRLGMMVQEDFKSAAALLISSQGHFAHRNKEAGFLKYIALKQTSLLAERTITADALTTKVEEQKELLKVISARSDEKQQEIAALSANLIELGKSLQASQEGYAAKQNEVRSLMMQLEKMQQEISSSSKRLKRVEKILQISREGYEQKQHAVQILMAQVDERQQEINSFSNHLSEAELSLQASLERNAEKQNEVNALTEQINGITSSTAWGLMFILWRIRLWLIPHNSKRERFIHSVLGWIRHLKGAENRNAGNHPKNIQPGRMLTKLFEPRGLFLETVDEVDRSQVTLFTDSASVCPDYHLREPLGDPSQKRHCKVSLIVSVKNERQNAPDWWVSIQHQSRLPDEIIIVDGGSSDGTDRLLEDWSKQSSILLLIVQAPGTNQAQARNIAIDKARFPVIAITDFGCIPQSDWLEKLVTPFELDAEIVVSAGFYDPVNRKRESLSRNGIWPKLEGLNPQDFLPSCRSIAVMKESFQAVGGFPEWLTNTGDDTYLDVELKRLGGEWAFVPQAIVSWIAPGRPEEYIKKMFKWAIGDGESGIHARYYWKYFVKSSFWLAGVSALIVFTVAILYWSFLPIGVWLGLILAIVVPVMFFTSKKYRTSIWNLPLMVAGEIGQAAGFITGARKRKEINQRRVKNIKGVCFILSGIPIDDTGGGARGTQLAMEFLRQGYAVVFINKFPKNESRELHLRFTYPGLYTFGLSEFHWERFLKENEPLFDGRLLTAIIEFPLQDYLPVIQNIRDHGGVVVYDLLDAWDTSLGRGWYSSDVELQIIHYSQLLIATAQLLADRLERLANREVILIPNAVDSYLFDPNRVYSRPSDFPTARWTAIYIGALWGEWFDWDLLKQVALNYPYANILVIGDYRGQCKDPPSNLSFLGLKAQQTLPAYLNYADVAIIPWKVNAITNATSPIKVFEYLAMLRPVVAPQLKPLEGIPGVYLAKNDEEFISMVGMVHRAPLDEKDISPFMANNTWRARVDQLLSQIQKARGESKLT
jgi:polysaccharide pyruvyl transferase CsaB